MASIRPRRGHLTRPVDSLQGKTLHDAQTRDAIFIPKFYPESARHTEARTSPLSIHSLPRKSSYDATQQAAHTPTMEAPQHLTLPDSPPRPHTSATKGYLDSTHASKRRGGCFSPPSHALYQSSPHLHSAHSLRPGAAVSGNSQPLSLSDWQNQNGNSIIPTGESYITTTPSLLHPTSNALYPELDRYRHLKPSEQPRSGQIIEMPCHLAAADGSLQAPVSIWLAASSQASATSGTPSTRQSLSPCSAPASRDTTPASAASQSPVTVTGRMACQPSRRNPAMTRPPITRRRTGSTSNDSEIATTTPGGLDVVRECTTSSSSGSTVRDGEKTFQVNKVMDTSLPSTLSSPALSGSGAEAANSQSKASASYTSTSSPRRPSQSPTKSRNPSRVSQTAPPKCVPPQRPSREGTQDMEPLFLCTTIPVIQSNLSSISRTTLRRGSEPTNARSLSGFAASLSHSKKNTSTPHLPLVRNPSSTELKKLLSNDRAQSSQTSAPKSASSFSSRFAFFTRKKADTDGSKCEKSETRKTQSRKGPVAGTGHEGYGRAGVPVRRVGQESLSTPTSLTSGDSFLADRICPVVIAGGEVIENHNTNPELNKGNDSTSPPGPAASGARLDGRNATVLRDRPDHRRPSGSSTKDGTMMESTLAFRRSMHRFRATPDDLMRLPQPINTRISSSSSSSVMASADTSITSAKSHVEKIASRESNDSRATTASKAPIIGRSPRKWNFFSRSQTRARSKNTEDKVQATISSVERKDDAFYTMLDPTEQGCSDSVDIQQVLRDAEVFPQMSPSADSVVQQAPEVQRPKDGQTFAPPSSTSPQPTMRHAPFRRQSSGSRDKSNISNPGRLAQVGRIQPSVKEDLTEVPPRSSSRRSQSDQSRTAKTEILSKFQPAASASGNGYADALKRVAACSPLKPNQLHRGPHQHHGPEPGRSPTALVTESGPSSVRNVPMILEGEVVSSPQAICPFKQATAVIPDPGDPPAEDEIWDEYDDLLDGDHSQRLPNGSLPSFKDADFSKSRVPKQDDEQVAEATGGLGLSSSARKHDSSNHDKTIHSIGSTTSSDEGSPLTQFNLRVGSITASKWLTFGHILFSDIRHELAAIKSPLTRPSILVIDGLGNDDWSYFASEAYPAASFYNLSPRERPSFEQQASLNFPSSPPNHYQVKYMSHLDKFPFATQSFSCMVYRFPAAAPESHYRNIVNEARRVLRPGGYIELSILDVDLNNMGNCGRRAVRGLKERVHRKASRTSLASTADLMVRLLGRAGFSHVKAARVGVPIATCSNKAGDKVETVAAKSKRRQREASSLADMMSDDSPMADESITRIVSRVGRWWYTRCYESAARLGEGSIWSDKALLSECEELGTSLKLLVCCARAPDRIISV
ncbi:hypothetical protein CDD81_4259 [Ophiocordyceps australis]|uniref:Methyltransferase type 11 domain-containing protein n=1 Tax=Ophiocordyceps australis TaxID=1399860 RepID=A0A2C5XW79_9HYPO|nr:hypothetical protein CDD81_4259 [Ophiocordyceps australis]